MMALVSPVAFWYGHPPWLRLSPASDIHTQTRRLSRSATLDGGAVFTDGGWCAADRTLALDILDLTPETAATLASIAASEEVHVALPEGLFRGRVSSFTFGGAATARLTVLVDTQVV